MRKISIIGSTGSIGRTALAVAHRQKIPIVALTAHSNLQDLSRQVQQFRPKFVGITDPSKFDEARTLFADFGEKLLLGRDALTVPAALEDVDTVLVAVVGFSGIHSVLAAIKAGKRVALANKESLVAGGKLITNAAKNAKNAQLLSEIIPVDSEHSAVFQCLKAGERKQVESIVLTASGGAFYTRAQQDLEKITPKDIFHPNWSMGRKITVDSSTMINKALEIIEAYWLFDTDKIDYTVHPQSIIHSCVSFCDGTTMAQLALPDMSLPIQYALSYPDRQPCINQFGFDKSLTFLPKNPLFFAPELAKTVIKEGGGAGVVFNAAAEAATELFEREEIGFLDITRVLRACLESFRITQVSSGDEVEAAHKEVKKYVDLSYKILRRV